MTSVLGTSVRPTWSPPIARIAPSAVPAGEEAVIVVTLTVPDGCHVQSNRPSEPFLIPTEVAFDDVEGIVVGDATYPPDEVHRYDWTPVELRVYRGEVAIVATVRATTGAGKGRRTLSGRIRYQGCTETACLPPAEHTFGVAVDVI